MAPVFSLNSRWLTASRIEVIAPEWAVKEINSLRSLEKMSSRNSFRRAVRAELDSRSSASQSSSSSVNPDSMGKSWNSFWMAERVLRLSQVWIPSVSRRSYTFCPISFSSAMAYHTFKIRRRLGNILPSRQGQMVGIRVEGVPKR